MPNGKRRTPAISCPDPGGAMRKRIHELVDDIPGGSVSDFVRVAVEDRLYEIEAAEAKVEQEKLARIKMACPTTLLTA